MTQNRLVICVPVWRINISVLTSTEGFVAQHFMKCPHLPQNSPSEHFHVLTSPSINSLYCPSFSAKKGHNKHHMTGFLHFLQSLASAHGTCPVISSTSIPPSPLHSKQASYLTACICSGSGGILMLP